LLSELNNSEGSRQLGSLRSNAGAPTSTGSAVSAILSLIAVSEGVSRSELACRTGLSKASVSIIVGELIDRGLVAEGNAVRLGQGPGRPASGLAISDKAPVVLGLEVNVGYVGAVSMDLGGRIRKKSLVFGDQRRPPEESILGLARLARRHIRRLAASGLSVAGIGVAVPGLVDGHGFVVEAPNLGWKWVPIAQMLEDLIGSVAYGVRADNEANLGALAEAHDGAGQGASTLLFVSAEVGVGSGVFQEGRLLRGAHGFAGELGHLVVERPGRPCRCGLEGCLETVVGLEGLASRLAPVMGGDAQDHPREVLARAITLAESGHQPTLEVLSRIGGTLGEALTSAVNLLDPELIVLGGHLGDLAPWLAPTVVAQLSRCMVGDRGSPRLATSRWGRLAALRGAAEMVRVAVLGDPRALLSLLP
jgi:predicted NBD/HSP70 family sugar kinase